RIVEKGSLSAAAVALDTSLPTVVRRLATLERHLGVRLLNRTTRRIHLTDEGTQYLERCRAILSAVQEAEAALASGRAEPRGRLSVTASVLFGRRYVAPIVGEFIQRYPHVSADLLFVDRVVNLIEEGIDVAIRIGHLRDSSLVSIQVGEVRRVVCASPQYLRRYGTPRTPDDVREHRCVRHTGLVPRNEWHFRSGRRNIIIPVTSTIACNDIDSSINACLNGLGLGMFLSYQVAAGRRSKKLVYVLEAFEGEKQPVHLVYPHSKLASTKVQVFVNYCVEKLRGVAFE
ncbi:MAG TPA: LysR family transcriptional regulator, partial [Burkholderiales bacterium]|nr:LysR family transcriptional regulator [Burkholderiales bacterium]